VTSALGHRYRGVIESLAVGSIVVFYHGSE
jgi:hypothetical protein